MAKSLGGAFVPNADYSVAGIWDGFNATGGTSGATGMNQRAELISGQGATVNLTQAQSGAICLFDRAAGIIYTLPPPVLGLYYDFITTVSITTNNATVATFAATQFMLGQVVNAVAAGTNTIFFADGTSTVKIQSNGTTSGGLIGSSYRVTCVSLTVWEVSGIVKGSGTIVTPFA